MKPVVLAVTSDHHVGSTIGLCPPEGVKLDDSGRYTPSPVQRWQWECWTTLWKDVAATVKREKADIWTIYNGDLFDGDHHHTTQIVSRNPEVQAYLIDRVMSVPTDLKPARQFVVRGTEAHVGPSGASEEAFARNLKHVVKDESSGRWSWWHLRIEVHGVRIDCQHHGRSGFRPWTEANAANLLAFQIWAEHARRELPYPHLAFRSHFHKYLDSYGAHKTRVIQTPAWQLKTAYAHKVVPESIADVGGVIVVIRPNQPPEVRPVLFQPELPPVWHA